MPVLNKSRSNVGQIASEESVAVGAGSKEVGTASTNSKTLRRVVSKNAINDSGTESMNFPSSPKSPLGDDSATKSWGRLKLAQKFAGAARNSLRRGAAAVPNEEEEPDINPFTLEVQNIDPADSEFKMSHLHISLENLTHDCWNANKPGGQQVSKFRKPRGSRSSRLSVAGGDSLGLHKRRRSSTGTQSTSTSRRRRSSLMRTDDEAAIQQDPALRLIRCIHKVISSNTQRRVQEQLQNLMLEFLKNQEEEEKSKVRDTSESLHSASSTIDRLLFFQEFRRGTGRLKIHPGELRNPPVQEEKKQKHVHRKPNGPLFDLARQPNDLQVTEACEDLPFLPKLNSQLKVLVEEEEPDDFSQMIGVAKASQLAIDKPKIERMTVASRGSKATCSTRIGTGLSESQSSEVGLCTENVAALQHGQEAERESISQGGPPSRSSTAAIPSRASTAAQPSRLSTAGAPSKSSNTGGPPEAWDNGPWPSRATTPVNAGEAARTKPKSRRTRKSVNGKGGASVMLQGSKEPYYTQADNLLMVRGDTPRQQALSNESCSDGAMTAEVQSEEKPDSEKLCYMPFIVLNTKTMKSLDSLPTLDSPGVQSRPVSHGGQTNGGLTGMSKRFAGFFAEPKPQSPWQPTPLGVGDEVKSFLRRHGLQVAQSAPSLPRASSAPCFEHASLSEDLDSKPKHRRFMQKSLDAPSALPPASPFDGEHGAPTPSLMLKPEQRYFEACVEKGIQTRVIKALTTPSAKIDLSGLSLSDADFGAILEGLGLKAPNTARVTQSPPTIPGRKLSKLSNTALVPSQLQRIDGLCLAGNPCLTDLCLASFFHNLGVIYFPRITMMRFLDLTDCSGLGKQSFMKLTTLLPEGLSRLEEFTLNGIQVPWGCWQALSEALASLTRLRALRLARTCCGLHNQQDVIAVSKIISTTQGPLGELDISGNHFYHHGCMALGEELRNAYEDLVTLDCSYNAGCGSDAAIAIKRGKELGAHFSINYTFNEGGEPQEPHMRNTYLPGIGPSFNPIMHIMEALGETCILHASFANCCCGYEEDCVLEDIVPSSEITHLDVSDNAHGEQGARCLVRLMTLPLDRDCGPLQSLRLEGGLRQDNAAEGTVFFDYTDPSAAYKLSCDHPHHRSILRMLLKRCEETETELSEAFTEVCMDKKPLKVPLESLCFKRLDRGGDDWQVPMEGVLSFIFSVPMPFNRLEDADAVWREFVRTRKVAVSLKAFVRVVSVFETCRDTRSQELLLEAMSKDLVFKMCQVKHLGSLAEHMYAFIVKTLLSAVDGSTSRMAMFELVNSVSQSPESPVRLETRNILLLNASHPDGHYQLDLTYKSDFGTAQRLITLGCWDKHRQMARHAPDISQHGNFETFRNAKHMGTAFVFDSKWTVPLQGTFEFDYVSPNKLNPLISKAIDKENFRELIELASVCECRIIDKITTIRGVAHQLVVTPDQVGMFLKVFPKWSPAWDDAPETSCQPRLEMYVLLYNRCIRQHELITPRYLYKPTLMHPSETLLLRQRLGWIHTFDPLNVDSSNSNLGNRHGPLDLCIYDEWIICKFLIALSLREDGENLNDTTWSEYQAFADRGYCFTVPATWVPDPPRIGDFTTTYYVKPVDQKMQSRLNLAKTFLGWHETATLL